jgi:DNA polymerase III subunit gamma/tau
MQRALVSPAASPGAFWYGATVPNGPLVPRPQEDVEVTLLTKSVRPRTFAEIAGQETVKTFLLGAIRDGTIPPALLFYGPAGTGKTTMARVLAAVLNCPSRKDSDACGTCGTCDSVHRGNYIDVFRFDAGYSGAVDRIRALTEYLYFHSSGRRVIIIDEAHRLSPEAEDVLLAVLEETGHQTVVIMTTTKAVDVAETLHQRCVELEFRPLDRSEVLGLLRDVVQAKSVPLSAEVVEEIASRARGSARVAVNELEMADRLRIRDVASLREHLGESGGALELFSAAVAGDLARGTALIDATHQREGSVVGLVDDLYSLVADLESLVSTGESAARSRDERGVHEALAKGLDAEALDSVVELLWHDGPRLRNRGRLQFAFNRISNRLAASPGAAPAEQSGSQHPEARPETSAVPPRDEAAVDEEDAWRAKSCARPRKSWAKRRFLLNGLEVDDDRCGRCTSCHYNSVVASVALVEEAGANALATFSMRPAPDRDTVRDRMKKIRAETRMEWAWYPRADGESLEVTAAVRVPSGHPSRKAEGAMRHAAGRHAAALTRFTMGPPTKPGAFLDHLLELSDLPVADAERQLTEHFAAMKGKPMFSSDDFLRWDGKPTTRKPALHQALRRLGRDG